MRGTSPDISGHRSGSHSYSGLMTSYQSIGTPASILSFVSVIVDRCRRQFPRHCPVCKRHFISFADYTSVTRSVGSPVEFDSAPDDPIGVVDFANCPCGTTISVSWEGPPGEERIALRRAIAKDVERLSMTPTAVLLELRAALWQTVVPKRSR